nr:LysR family transcriptional regulator [Novosphingobium hassiacum]
MKASTVSRRIRDLEFQLGTAIFERNRHRIAPTPIGRIFLERAGDLLREFHGLVAGIRRIGDGKAGTVAVGFHGPIGDGPLADLLFQKIDPLPDLRLVPVEMPRDRLAGALSSCQIDVAIVRGPPDIASTDTLPLAGERLVAVLPQEHALAARERIGWPALANETVMLSRPDCGDALITGLAQRMHAPGMNGSVEVHDIGTCSILALVARGRGVSISTEAIRAHAFEGVAVCDLEETLEVHACWDPDSPNPVVGRFLRLLRCDRPHRQSVCVSARA